MIAALLLNWRTWVIVSLLACCGYMHHRGYVSGKAEVQSVFDAYKTQDLEQALAAQAAQTLKEQAMQAANTKVSENYESLKTATATAVRALDADRMRLQNTIASYRRTTGSDTAPSSGIDGAAQIDVLAGCIDRRVEVAKDAAKDADTLKALQEYVSNVVKP